LVYDVALTFACLQSRDGFRHMRMQRTARGWNVLVGKDQCSFSSLTEFLDSPLARKSGKSACLLPSTHSALTARTHQAHTHTKQRAWD
jgi:hypothetical protein